MEIRNIKVYDLKESIIACQNSMRVETPEYNDEQFETSLIRARILASKGNGHNNFLCGIRVSFDLIYPQYITPELQRYHWVDIVNSSSKMHRLAEITTRDSFNKYVNDRTKENVKMLVKKYNNDKTYENFMAMISNCPLGLELFMRISTNYLQLRTIYKQRKNHKLKEDWGVICKMIEELPYKELIIC